MSGDAPAWRSPEAALGLLFAVTAAALGLSGRLPDDEGYLTFIGASVVARAPLAGLFFQKIHPSTSALYAPFAAAGWRAFLLAHAALGGVTVFLLGRVARRNSVATPWLPPLLLAASPLFLLCASTGLSNSTAVFFLVAAMALLDGGPRAALAGGVLAAAGLWSRYEQAPYLLALVGFDVARRRRPHAALGMVAAVGLYVVAGALYHRDAAWLFARPPVMPREVGPSTMGDISLDRHNVGSLLVGFFLLTPAAMVPALLRRADARPLTLWLAATLLLSLSAQLALPQLGRLFNFDYTARYFVCHLPALVLLASETAGSDGRSVPRAAALAALGVAAAALLGAGMNAAVLAALFALPCCLSLTRHRVATLAAAAVIGVAVAPLVGARHVSALPVPGLDDAVREVLRSAAAPAVYSNAHQLQALLDARGATRRVRFLVGHDMVNELATELGGRRTRQSDAVFRALRPVVYGEVLWPCEFPHRPPPGSLLVLTRRERAAAVYDLRAWIGASQLTLRAGEVEVWRVAREVTVSRSPPPPWMAPGAIDLPCAER